MNRQYKRNLTRLGKYLYSLPDDYAHFDMNFYFSSNLPDSDLCPATTVIKQALTDPTIAGQCGTAACALGHGPVLGYGLKTIPGETWDEYGSRVFGLEPFNRNHKDLWEWMFSSQWGEFTSYNHIQSLCDDTPQGAGLRLLWIAYNGLMLPKFMQNYLNRLNLEMSELFIHDGSLRYKVKYLQRRYDDWKLEWAKTVEEMLE